MFPENKKDVIIRKEIKGYTPALIPTKSQDIFSLASGLAYGFKKQKQKFLHRISAGFSIL